MGVGFAAQLAHILQPKVIIPCHYGYTYPAVRWMGGHPAESVGAGEYCYRDESGQILCRLDYKQCDQSKINLSTTGCLFIIQGHVQTPTSVLSQARERLIGLLHQFCFENIAK